MTRFVNDDVLFDPVRDWVEERFGPDSKAAYLLECPWCASIWVGLPVALVAYWWGDQWWFIVGAVWLCLSYLTGLALTWLERDE